MTNEQAKQETIKKAYGDKWDLVKDHIREYDGSIPTFPFLMEDGHEDDGFYYKQIGYTHDDINPYIGGDMEPSRWRVKELDYIENNNGWIRIEPDGSNLPEKYPMVKYKALKQDGLVIEAFSWDIRSLFTQFKVITHYKPIEPELKPIY